MMHVNNCAFPDLASVAEKYAAYLGVTAAKITRINDTHHETEQRTNATALAEQVRALCDMSMEQQVREYLNQCSQAQAQAAQALQVTPGLVPPGLVGPLVPPTHPLGLPPLAPPPPPPSHSSPSPQHNNTHHPGDGSPLPPSLGGLGPPSLTSHSGHLSSSSQTTAAAAAAAAAAALAGHSTGSSSGGGGGGGGVGGANIGGRDRDQQGPGGPTLSGGQQGRQQSSPPAGAHFTQHHQQQQQQQQQQQALTAAFGGGRGGGPLGASPGIPHPLAASSPVAAGGQGGPAGPGCPQQQQAASAPAALNHTSSVGSNSATSGNSNRVLSRNANGTIAMTSQPSNESELQLYRVLQRANLLAYFDTFICQGGDDVQQLCEAGEEEFLEIMALVGMASKPLHVRRLQKALQEWVQNPAMFQSPLVSGGSGGPPTAATGGAACPSSGGGLPRGQLTQPGPGNLRPPSHGSNSSSSNSNNNSNSHNNNSNNNNSNNNSNNNNNGTSSLLPPGTSSTSTRDGQLPGQKRPASSVLDTSTTPGLIGTGATVNTPQQQPQQQQQPHGLSFSLQQNGGRLSPSSPSSGGGLGSGSVSSVSSVTSSSCLLDEQQLTKIGDVAELLVRSILPTLSPFDLKNMKKRLPKEMEFILTMSEDDPRRLEEIRRCAAIYTIPPQPTGSGKRKAASASAVPALGPYELAVNEAAAQICRHVPALLSRHEELFPLARQVVRDCAFNQFAKTDVECRSPAQTTAAGTPSASKRARAAELGFPAADKAQVEDERRKRQERLEHINEQLRSLGRQQEELKLRLGAVRDVALAAGIQQQLEQISHQQMQLLNDQNDVSKQLKRIEKFMNSPKFATIAAAAAAAAASSGSSLALGGVGSGSIDVMSVKTPGGQDTDDTDSQLSAQSFSNAASPPAPSANVVSADMANLLGNSSAMHSQQQQQHSSIGGGGGGGGVAPGGTLQQQQTSSSSIGGGRESPLIDSAAALWKQQQLQQLQQSQQHSKQQQKTSQQITKQLVQETLMDEGLRVIRELANQIKGCADTEALEAAVVAGAAVAAVASSPSSIMPLSLTCSSKQQQQQQQQQAQQQQTSAEQQSQQTNSTTTLAGGSSMNNNGGNNANNNCNSNSSNSSATGRPRGRPPRLDRGDFVGTSRTISGSSGPSPPPLSASPLNMSRPSSRSPNPPPVAGVSLGASEQSQQQSKNNNGSNSSCLLDGNPASNGHHHKSHNGSAEPENSTENSLNALLALSQKGMLKQEPGSPAPSPSPSQQSIKI